MYNNSIEKQLLISEMDIWNIMMWERKFRWRWKWFEWKL